MRLLGLHGCGNPIDSCLSRLPQSARPHALARSTVAGEQWYELSKKTKSRLFPWSGCNMGWQEQKQKASRTHNPEQVKPSRATIKEIRNIAKKEWSQPPKPWHQHRHANVVRDRAQGLSGSATVLGPRSHNGMETQSKIHRCRMAGPWPLVRGV